jgi:eukaryotic-like serine/threonine-protein kinase
VAQVSEGPGTEHGIGLPASGEVLAERYQLEQHINTDSAGRQIWRGVDVILRRPVAVLIRYPGGPAAAQMLQTAVEASRIVHPNLVGVYDAIDEHVRAYVVREWVDGASLREHTMLGPFDAARAIAVAHAVSAAAATVHASGMTHGNIHPGTVLIGLDGRVVLADARADGTAPADEDVRAVGALLYFALTGYWPHAEMAGPTSLPDAMRDSAGALAAPRQVRAGVPDHLDNLTMDLLDRRLAVPPAEVLAGELGRLDSPPHQPYDQTYDQAYEQPYEQSYDNAYYANALAAEPVAPVSGTGPIRFSPTGDEGPTRPSGRKIALGLAGLLVVGVLGLLVGVNLLVGEDTPSDPAANPEPAATGTAPPASGQPPSGEVAPIPLEPSQVRVVDPPNGNRAELVGVETIVDDDLSDGWASDTYTTADFGSIKPGMGILINLGQPRHVATVRVELGAAGATAEIRAGNEDPGNDTAGDEQIYQTYEPVGEPQQQGGTTMVFSSFDPQATYQYLMVWFTELPPDGDGFRVEVQQVVVEGN